MIGALLTTTASDRVRPLHLVGDQRSHPLSDERQRRRLTGRYAPVQGAAGTSSAPVLLAGIDAEGRSAMLGELRNLLPAGTGFVEVSETWELLTRAEGSQMVVLTDDLGDLSSASLVRLLGRRHPGLPVLAVEGRVATGDRSGVGAASV
jgi:hypothetical protein